MKKKLFVVSDIHGYYDILSQALKEVKFDKNNPEHLLIVLGDSFDRGNSSLEVYRYLKKLTDKGKAVVIKGNHDSMLEKYLDGTSLNPFNYLRNGTSKTLANFLDRTCPFESWCAIDKGIVSPTYGDFARWITEAREEINKKYPELLEWLKNRPYYYETKNYIFTHGSIDTKAADWRKPHCVRYDLVDWEALMWDDGSFFGKEINNTDKTVIIGHFGTSSLREKYNIKDNKDEFDILKREDGKVIAIDTTTALSFKINVLVIEDEIIN